MHRAHIRRVLAALLASLAIAATAIPPIGGLAGAATGANCSAGDGIVCYLDITAPQSVLTGVPFTVTVSVYADFDRTAVAKGDPCGSDAPIRLEIENEFEGPYEATLFATAMSGVATFQVTIPAGTANDGLYTLGAFGDYGEGSDCGFVFFDPASAPLMAVTVPATQPIAPCPEDVSCKQVLSGTGSAATLIAEQGTFTATFGTLVVADGCADGGPADPNGVLTFDYAPGPDGSFPKTIILALSRERVTKGIGQFKICWHSINAFTPLGGGPQVLTGYLPACKKNDLGPCVLFQKANQHNTGFFGILAPEIDPKAYPK
ncbi:MAG TPA: hypothetical protein VIF84_10655 [Candidatus Limnocylindrales bacterium]|jgi:hypothetical protein